MLEQYIKDRIANGKVKLDLKGHFGLPAGILTLAEILELGYTEHIVDQFLHSVELIRLAFDTDAEIVAIRKKLKNFEEIPWYTISQKSSLNDCGECSQDVGFEFNGKLIRTTCDCLNPGGLGPYSVEIPVPSGKLIFTNDLRILVRTERDYNVNQRLETKLCCEDYARGGMIHFFVGNTCPGVFRNSDTSLFVGNEGSAAYGNSIWDDEKGEEVTPTPEQVIAAEFKDCKKLGNIDTGLWWYSAIDYDLAMKICKEMELKWTHDESDFFVVNVKPGIYRATSLYHTIEQEFDIAQVYSTIDWVRECTESDMPVIKIDESLTAITLKESHLWKSWRRAVDGKYKNLYPTFTGWLQNKFCVAGSGDAWDNGVITHEGRGKAWFKTNICDCQAIKDFNPPSIKETDFEKSIWTFPQLEFLARPKVDKDVTDFFASDPDSVVTHSIIYPLSDSFGPINGMPYEVNEYYLAAQLTFFATLIKYPMFFPEDYGISVQIKIVEKILDILYVNVIERKLEERMKEIFAEFEAAGSDLTDVHENYSAYV